MARPLRGSPVISLVISLEGMLQFSFHRKPVCAQSTWSRDTQSRFLLLELHGKLCCVSQTEQLPSPKAAPTLRPCAPALQHNPEYLGNALQSKGF